MENGNAAARVIQDLRRVVAVSPAGARLASVRELTARHQASPVTVAAAIRQLVVEGLVETRNGRGTFVAARPDRSRTPDLSWQTVALGPARSGEHEMQALLALPPSGAISLSSGYLDTDLQPAAALGAALARAARQPASWQRGPAEGREDLRAWFAREAGGGLRAEDMVICPGGQAALSTALRALTVPGDTVLVESPTYLGALAAARAAGLRVVPVPADADGVRPDQLAAAFTRTRARLFYCQPLYANPTGASLAASRRAAIAETVRAAGAFLIEDDYARDLTMETAPPPPLAADDPDGHVIYLRSLTKAAAPGLRVAAIGARGPAGTRLRAARLLDDFFVSGPLQQATCEFVCSPAWTRHRTTLRTALRARRDALLTALSRHLPDLVPPRVPRGGLHLWAPLPGGADDTALAAAAAAQGVIVFPGRPWFAAEPTGPYLRLTFAASPPELMDEAVRRLARAF
ncbi:putative GntR-family transcriptional regulator [Actinoplanes missouriensis 431]|uniref:Putative GntR-family transcriptional regulator n=1 Tax=Actinoplanes missouriensis (strain ATCC 14538 / DSM 43046 / CBS 188.64 / JCM 3121 / NBRC 102363 / NCIMB 12654 / NRRL B-3342 / UNCC 431) TaxID=512565 RepID=I0H6E1_ACTM4|nr:PLP-dependent aminotransferase family protein [Actinoplanes missouriensis]BAL88578.1 putative GntR-family transcriptional regulator [Actinoplanes missouriensis 431]